MGYRLAPALWRVFLSLALLAQTLSAPVARAQEPPVHLALGDSLAFGLGASDRESRGYVARAHEAFLTSDRYRERGLELINLSIPGATSTDLVAEGGQLDNAVAVIGSREDTESADDDVEIITLDIGGNDLLSLVSAGSPCLQSASVEPCRAAFGGVLSAIQTNLTETLTRLREAAPEAILVVVDLYNPYSGTGDLREAIAELGVGQANGVIGAVTANPDFGVRTASIFQLFSGRGGQWIAPDGIHPNDSGHAVIAEAVVAATSGREPVIPDELLAVSPGATAPASPGGTGTPAGQDSDGVSDLFFGVAIVIAFAAGAAVSGVYFFARGGR